MGRPSKLTEALAEAIAGRVAEHGTPPEVAAGCEGIGRRTYYEWMERGRAGEEPYAAFAHGIARAKDLAEQEMLAEVRRPDESTDWRSRAWILERTRRDRYGPEIRIQAHAQAVDELLGRLRERADPSVYEAVLVALADGEGEGGATDDEGGDPVE